MNACSVHIPFKESTVSVFKPCQIDLTCSMANKAIISKRVIVVITKGHYLDVIKILYEDCKLKLYRHRMIKLG